MKLTDTNTFEIFKPLADNIEAHMIGMITTRVERFFEEFGAIYPKRGELRIRNPHDRFGMLDTPKGKAWKPVQSWIKARDEGYHIDGHAIVLNTEWLNKKMKQFAEDAVLGFVAKTIKKIGDIDDLTLNFKGGADFTLTGTRNGRKVTIDQQTVYKWNSRNEVYCQFPARIYIDGQFTPAKDFEEKVAA